MLSVFQIVVTLAVFGWYAAICWQTFRTMDRAAVRRVRFDLDGDSPMTTTSCPNCGTPVELAGSESASAVCPGCRAVVRRSSVAADAAILVHDVVRPRRVVRDPARGDLCCWGSRRSDSFPDRRQPCDLQVVLGVVADLLPVPAPPLLMNGPAKHHRVWDECCSRHGRIARRVYRPDAFGATRVPASSGRRPGWKASSPSTSRRSRDAISRRHSRGVRQSRAGREVTSTWFSHRPRSGPTSARRIPPWAAAVCCCRDAAGGVLASSCELRRRRLVCDDPLPNVSTIDRGPVAGPAWPTTNPPCDGPDLMGRR